MARELELRKLQPRDIYQLVQMLEIGDGWKKLMTVIPKNGTAQPFESKYTFEHLKMIEHAGISQKRPCSEILIEEWGTSGRKQPNLALLLELLVNAELFRAAEYVAVDLLKEAAPRRPVTGIAADITVSDETVQNLLNLQAENPSLFLKEPVTNSVEIEPSEDRVSVNISQHFAPTHEGNYLRNYSPHSVTQNVVVPRRSDESDDMIVIDSEVQRYSHGLVNRISDIVNVSLNVPEEVNLSSGRLPIETSNNENSDAVAGSNSSLQLNTLLPHVPYSELELCTGNFCEDLLTSRHQINEGRKLGTGAFGSVYLGVYPRNNYVAVKRLKRDVVNIEKQFKNEVEALSRYQHPHLLPLLGYSCDGAAYCLVYEYMCNGSLQEKLACQGSTPVLPWETRLKVALGTSQGILYLHTAYEKPLIHRDIKSANILLDQNFVPKLGDFGLVRLGANGQQSHSIALTSTVFGTSAYMAPEAFRGDISVKLDSFSFGVVVLELLTSLPPYDEKREGCDLVTHVEDICEGSIEPLLDSKAGNWGKSATVQPAEIFYSLALDCLKEKRHRPNMDSIVRSIQDILTSCL